MQRLWRRVIQNVENAFGFYQTIYVDFIEEISCNRVIVVDIDIGVYHKEHLGKGHLPCTP